MHEGDRGAAPGRDLEGDSCPHQSGVQQLLSIPIALLKIEQGELGETFRSTHGAGALQLPALGLFHSAVDAQGLQKAGEQEVQIVDAGDFLHDQAQDVGDTVVVEKMGAGFKVQRLLQKGADAVGAVEHRSEGVPIMAGGHGQEMVDGDGFHPGGDCFGQIYRKKLSQACLQ